MYKLTEFIRDNFITFYYGCYDGMEEDISLETLIRLKCEVEIAITEKEGER